MGVNSLSASDWVTEIVHIFYGLRHMERSVVRKNLCFLVGKIPLILSSDMLVREEKEGAHFGEQFSDIRRWLEELQVDDGDVECRKLAASVEYLFAKLRTRQ